MVQKRVWTCNQRCDVTPVRCNLLKWWASTTSFQGTYGVSSIRSGGPFGRAGHRTLVAAVLALPEARGKRCIPVHVTIVEI